MQVKHTGGTGPLKGTGKLPIPPKPAAHAPAHKPEAPKMSRSEALHRLHEVVDAKDAKLPWRNNADMNAKLTRVIQAKIKAGHVRSAAGVNAIVHGVVAQNRSKITYWNYDFHIDNTGKVNLKLDFKGKMDAFDS